MGTDTAATADSEMGARARALYERLRPDIETPENIRKIIIMDVDSGDYEIDDGGIASSQRLQARHPGVVLYALRIGYKSVGTLSSILERTSS